MRRRTFITGLAGATVASPLTAVAQQSKRLPVVGFVSAFSPLADLVGSDPINLLVRAFVHGLRDLNWIEGRTVIIERRSTGGDPQRAPAIFAELLARGVDVIMLGSARWLHEAALAATRTIPIVVLFSDDPVAAGLINSLARPGGNLTGVTQTAGPEFFAKRLQLLGELAPRITRPAFLGARTVLDQYRGVARPAGVTVVPVQVDAAGQLKEALATILAERADAMMVAEGPVPYDNARRIVAFAAENRLPTIYANREAVEAGGLMSYGPSPSGLWRQAARLVDRFIKGAKIGDIPVEQPTKFELVINLKTARALGLTLPPDMLLGTDAIIE